MADQLNMLSDARLTQLQGDYLGVTKVTTSHRMHLDKAVQQSWGIVLRSTQRQLHSAMHTQFAHT